MLNSGTYVKNNDDMANANSIQTENIPIFSSPRVPYAIESFNQLNALF